jgi:hypothetical protein
MRQLWKLGNLGKCRVAFLPPGFLLAPDTFSLFASTFLLLTGEPAWPPLSAADRRS